MYQYKCLSINDINQIKVCRDLVVANLIDRSIFIEPSESFLNKILLGYGVTIGAFDNNKLIGFTSISRPDSPFHNLSKKIGYSYNTFEQLEHYLVLPEYREQNIATNLCNILFTYSKRKYIVCLAAPNNIPSLSLCFKLGFKIEKLIKLENGYHRFILIKNKTEKPTDLLFEKISEVSLNDIIQINQMLSNGYKGLSFDENKEKIILSLLKIKGEINEKNSNYL